MNAPGASLGTRPHNRLVLLPQPQGMLVRVRVSPPLELEAGAAGRALRSALAPAELEAVGGGGRRHLGVLLLVVTEVLLDDLVGELVDLHVLVVLQRLDLVQAAALLHHRSHLLHLDLFEIFANICYLQV